MANAFKLTSKVATNAMLLLLKNNLVFGRNAGKKFNKEFGNREMQIGSTLTIRRPQEFIVRSGASFTQQEIVTGSSSVTIDQQKGVDITWAPTERELSVDELLQDSVLNAKMAALAQDIESSIADKALEFASWVGTPGQVVNSAADFLLAPRRLDEFAVPVSDRIGILPPEDFYAVGASFSTQTFFGNDINDNALLKMRVPMIGSIQPYMAQTYVSLTTGTRAGTPLVNGASQNVNYSAVKDTYSQSLILDGLGAGQTVKRGEVLTIANVNAVNPRTKQSLGYLQQFVVLEDATADGSGNITLTIANPIIAATGSGVTLRTNQAFQTVDAAPADNAAVTFMGSASTTYRLPVAYHKDALQLCFVKPARPFVGEYSYASDPETGLIIRNWAFSDGSADTHSVRCDVLYGVTNYDRRLGTKLSGTA